MRKRAFFAIICGVLFAGPAFGGLITEVDYTVTDLGSNLWQYTYEVKNISLVEPLMEFTIWFDYGKYDNLSIATPNQLSAVWNQIIMQPEPVLKDAGYYDALSLELGIGQGQTVNGFAVSFDWLGVGQPGPQFYEIIDPVTFETIDSGYSVPEPATILLIGLGGLVLQIKRKA